MEIANTIFEWLKAPCQVVQDSHVQKRKKTSVVLTQEATRAMLSGHIVFFVASAVAGKRGIPVTQAPVGNAGEAVSGDGCHYNWSLVCEMLAAVGVGLSPDHRMLLGNGDPGIIVDLLNTLQKKLTAEPKPRAAKSPSPRQRGAIDPHDRGGAVSVDQGKERLRKLQADGSAAFDVFKDIERIRLKREEKLAKKREAEERAKEIEHKMKIIRDKLNPVERKGLLAELDVSSAPLPCYLEFVNRSVVQFCHAAVLELVASVSSGEAQTRLKAKELEKARAKELATKRRTEGDRLLALGAVTVAREADHRTVVMCRDLVYELIKHASLPETRDWLRRREQDREIAAKNAEKIQKKIEMLYDMRSQRRKHEDIRKEEEEAARREREKRAADYEKNRKLNELQAAKSSEEQKKARLQKELSAKLKEEEGKRKEAERVLYYAEQKAKVLETRRAKAVEDTLRKARSEEESRELRELRRQKAAEISKKLMEKELHRDNASNTRGVIPTTLSPISLGTGQRSGYTGNSLGWQFLTDDERHVAELVHSVRTDLAEAVHIVMSRMENTVGRMVWFTDQCGRRHPLPLVEGNEVQESLVESLRKAPGKGSNVEMHVSIALTLAARCHAIDLAHHGIADPAKWHIGTDGSSATQRAMRFGTGLGGPGTTQEVVVSVVRPIDVQLSATDVIGFALVDDGCRSRENREALLRSVALPMPAGVQTSECFGVGHAIATCGADTVVEVFVILFASGTYTDKQVSQLAAAQHTSLRATSEAFLEDDRTVSKSVATKKKDLYLLNNVTIGRRTDGLRSDQIERLARHRVVADPPPRQEEETFVAPPPIKKQKAKATRRADASAAADLYDGEEAAGQRNSRDLAGAGDSGAESKLRRRLSSFFQKYAPEREVVVDAALELNRGREEEMFSKLTEKYGPEPVETSDKSFAPSTLKHNNNPIAPHPSASEAESRQLEEKEEAREDDEHQGDLLDRSPEHPDHSASHDEKTSQASMRYSNVAAEATDDDELNAEEEQHEEAEDADEEHHEDGEEDDDGDEEASD